MAIYHFSAKVVSRANGSSAVASAAYRAAERLTDDRLGRDHDFTNKAGVVHSEIMLPEGAPERLADRETLWNAVEAGEVRKDAQLARDVEFAIPREMAEQDGIALARDFVAREFVARGMIADLNVHWDKAADGSPKPHAHVMLSMREVGPDGFGQKERDWNSKELLQEWRTNWADHVNTRMAELGRKYELRIANVFHAGDGNLHPLILFDANDPGQLHRAELFGADILETSVALGGTVTGEHGVGVEKLSSMCVQFSPAELGQMLALKHAFDPAGGLNPGKVIPTLSRCAEYGKMHVKRGLLPFPELERF